MKERLKRLVYISGGSVEKFQGKKKYFSTGNINTNNYELVTYCKRPSRANSVVKDGDILIAKMRNTNKTTIATKEMENNIYSTGFTILNTNKLHKKYLYYLLSSTEFIEQKDALSVGITQLSINDETLLNMEVEYVNDIIKQEKIANFLDEKVLEIDEVIDKTKKTIEDYKKYKQSIITKAIENASQNNKVKDKQWKKTKIKYIADINPKCEAKVQEDEEVTYTPMECIKNGHYIQNIGLWGNNTSSYNTYLENDIVMAKVTPCFENGNIAIMSNLVKGIGYGSSELIVFRCKKDIENKYLFYLLQSEIFKDQCTSTMTGTGGLKRVSIDFIKNYVCYIPDRKEQKKIINYLDLTCKQIEQLIQSKVNFINELESYKKSLVYEYVTGKKEVKNSSIVNMVNVREIKINCKDNIFAQAILLCRIIEKLNKYKLGRVKAEKTLYLIEKNIGFNFNNNYVREAAGPLCDAIYKCESIISKKNKWVKVKNVRKHIEYEMLEDFNKYEKYYEKYYSNYDNEIEKIIEIIKKCSTDEAEMIATLYASWNDFIIKGEKASDIQIVKDVRENWNDSKKRFDEEKWLNVLNEMKKVGLVPKGYGNLTIIKEQ